MKHQTTKWRVCVAPMLDWTDRYYRFMAQQISQHARLYTEMIHANALLFGNTEQFLAHDEGNTPPALQLGGNDPTTLAQCAKIAENYGYDEVNLNCGCPSERVQKGSFGASLMQESTLVADCLKAMQDASSIDITLKHRIGIDKINDYSFVRDFVGEISTRSACQVFIVHARNAWLKGLSPKENREIPPLKYDFVYQLKQDFPHLIIVINGGIQDNLAIHQHLNHVDGVMIGRSAYHNPMMMATWDSEFFANPHPIITLPELVETLYQYTKKHVNNGINMRSIVRHYLGIMYMQKGAKHWRQTLSDAKLLADNNPELLHVAFSEITF